jgi:hypothetical protein
LIPFAKEPKTVAAANMTPAGRMPRRHGTMFDFIVYSTVIDSQFKWLKHASRLESFNKRGLKCQRAVKTSHQWANQSQAF